MTISEQNTSAIQTDHFQAWGTMNGNGVSASGSTTLPSGTMPASTQMFPKSGPQCQQLVQLVVQADPEDVCVEAEIYVLIEACIVDNVLVGDDEVEIFRLERPAV